MRELSENPLSPALELSLHVCLCDDVDEARQDQERQNETIYCTYSVSLISVILVSSISSILVGLAIGIFVRDTGAPEVVAACRGRGHSKDKPNSHSCILFISRSHSDVSVSNIFPPFDSQT